MRTKLARRSTDEPRSYWTKQRIVNRLYWAIPAYVIGVYTATYFVDVLARVKVALGPWIDAIGGIPATVFFAWGAWTRWQQYKKDRGENGQ